jgi:hypothetical protein
VKHSEMLYRRFLFSLGSVSVHVCSRPQNTFNLTLQLTYRNARIEQALYPAPPGLRGGFSSPAAARLGAQQPANGV